jgi:hypothetical protein
MTTISGTWNFNGTYSTQTVSSGSTPYKTYFTVPSEVIDSAQMLAKGKTYADSNGNGSWDSSDIYIGDVNVKSYDTLGGWSGTFNSPPGSNTIHSFIGNTLVGEARFESRNAWGLNPGGATSTSAGTTVLTGASSNSSMALSVQPSTFQVNEGDSLTTTLSGFTPGSTVYFKVVGRGINKKDFAAGGVKGSLKVDANGVATISHTLRADKATEGDESFAIQVFSDKKMRNLLGESDAVTVIDTSVKAGKGSKGGGSKSGRDPVTGLYVELIEGSRRLLIKSDEIFRTSDIYGPSGEDDPVNATVAEWEFGKSFIAYTGTGTWSKTDPRQYVVREVFEGDFSYDNKGRMTSANVKAKAWSEFNWPDGDDAAIHVAPQAKKVSDTRSLRAFGETFDYVGDGDFQIASKADQQLIKDFGGGRFFYEGWWQEPFTSNLIN